MKIRLFLLTAIMLMVSTVSFSQVSNDKAFYQSKDGSLYFINDIVIVGQPSSTTHTYNFIESPIGQQPTVGDTIVLKGFYQKGSVAIAYGAVDKLRYNIAFEVAIETGEVLSHEAIQKRNNKHR